MPKIISPIWVLAPSCVFHLFWFLSADSSRCHQLVALADKGNGLLVFKHVYVPCTAPDFSCMNSKLDVLKEQSFLQLCEQKHIIWFSCDVLLFC